MSKGERTRTEIIHKAFLLAGDIGLEGLSLGTLATETGLSKSGLFAHFKSKEALQLEVLAEIERRFSLDVVQPALKQPRGEQRVRALFENYLTWIGHSRPRGGCIYMALCHEYDDRPGPIRDRLQQSQRAWTETVARVVRTGVEEGHFRADLDIDQFVYEFLGIKMAYHYWTKSLQLSDCERMVRVGFESLIARSHTVS